MKKLVELTTLWEYEDTSGGLKPSDSTFDLQFDLSSQHPPEISSEKATDPDLQGMKEKESSNGHDISTFAIFHIVNHNIRSER
jgi:hypothetical protein